MKRTNKNKMENKSLLKNEDLLIKKFQVEELEKRYEMAWIGTIKDLFK